MNGEMVDLIELIAWGLDEYSFRDAATDIGLEDRTKRIARAQERLSNRDRYISCEALASEETKSLLTLLTHRSLEEDLQREYAGLDWSLGIVDLRRLIAFQRRLVSSSLLQRPLLPGVDDWPQLISLAFNLPRSTDHNFLLRNSTNDGLNLTIYSNNPDLQLRLDHSRSPLGSSRLSIYGGSPFFEVAKLNGRWFLRDGYHRAYALLQAGIYRMPSVVIHARDISELGATKPWFFSEDQLFCDRPPMVTDFLDEVFVLRYKRPALRKVIRVRVEESLEPFADEVEEIQGGAV